MSGGALTVDVQLGYPNDTTVSREEADMVLLNNARCAQFLPSCDQMAAPIIECDHWKDSLFTEPLFQNLPNLFRVAIEVTHDQVLSLEHSSGRVRFINSYHRMEPLWLFMSSQSFGQLTSWEQAVLLESCAGLTAGMEDLWQDYGISYHKNSEMTSSGICFSQKSVL